MAEAPVKITDRILARRRERSRSFVDRFARSRSTWTMSLNLTSMIDVVFLLLFFFLASSRFTPSEGTLAADLPARGPAIAGVSVPRIPIYIRFAADASVPEGCRMTIDRFHPTPLPTGELATTLEKIRDDVPGFDGQTPVYLVADDGVPWDFVVNGYNAAMFARFEKIYFAGTKP
jgi:biopolymer transport protein ExbD